MKAENFTFDPDDPLARADTRETPASLRALRDYAMMGSGRSLRALLERYRELNESWDIGHEKPPTKRYATLAYWSMSYAWQERVKRYDELEHQKRQAAVEQERELWRDRRRQLAQGFFAKAAKALANANDEDNLSIMDAAKIVQAALREMRFEYEMDNGYIQTDGATIRIVEIIKTDDDKPD